MYIEIGDAVHLLEYLGFLACIQYLFSITCLLHLRFTQPDKPRPIKVNYVQLRQQLCMTTTKYHNYNITKISFPLNTAGAYLGAHYSQYFTPDADYFGGVPPALQKWCGLTTLCSRSSRLLGTCIVEELQACYVWWYDR